MPGLDLEVAMPPQHQFGCEASKATTMMIPSRDYGNNRIGSQKAHKLRFH